MNQQKMKTLMQDVVELSLFALLAVASLSLIGEMETRMLAAMSFVFLIPAVASSAMQVYRDVKDEIKPQLLC